MSMRCRPGRCCGELHFKASCPYCWTLAHLVKLLDWRGNIRLVRRGITKEDYAIFGAPEFRGDEGTIVRGFHAVSLRVCQELFLTSRSLRSKFGGTDATSDPGAALPL